MTFLLPPGIKGLKDKSFIHADSTVNQRIESSQLILTYSKSTIEILEKDMKYVQMLTIRTPEWYH